MVYFSIINLLSIYLFIHFTSVHGYEKPPTDSVKSKTGRKKYNLFKSFVTFYYFFVNKIAYLGNKIFKNISTFSHNKPHKFRPFMSSAISSFTVP